MMLQKRDVLLTHSADVLKQFYIMGIVFHLSFSSHSVQMKETPGVQIENV